ncbi:MAG: hypothetical protein GX265_04655 [Mollicutes bacterium]|nr:hypothetical protein [Mollicutes bacterium]
MKILKKRIFQIISIAVFIIAISFIVYSSTRPVYADDTVDMGLFNTKIAELQEQIDSLTTEINTLKEENISLNNEIKDNSDTMKELENIINAKDKEILKLNKWYNKNKELYTTTTTFEDGTKAYYNANFIKTRLKEFFEQN